MKRTRVELQQGLLFCGCGKPYWGVGGLCAGSCAEGESRDNLNKLKYLIPFPLRRYRRLLDKVTKGDSLDVGISQARLATFVRDGNLPVLQTWETVL